MKGFHRLGAFVSFLPLLVVIVSGLLLQMRDSADWIEPAQVRGAGGPPVLTMERALFAARNADVGIADWADVEDMNFRPELGSIIVRGINHNEVQVDANTGAVLSAGPRRSGWIAALHDGSWFHPRAKTLIFLPVGLILLAQWLTGVWLWIAPYYNRARRRRDMFA
ncbi:MAG: putative iron-regulated membrane protein [Planctomycetota bacterium]|jgi:uncharacterized iron-regulated membrane protein